jgi:hypothetical protein
MTQFLIAFADRGYWQAIGPFIAEGQSLGAGRATGCSGRPLGCTLRLRYGIASE